MKERKTTKVAREEMYVEVKTAETEIQMMVNHLKKKNTSTFKAFMELNKAFPNARLGNIQTAIAVYERTC